MSNNKTKEIETTSIELVLDNGSKVWIEFPLNDYDDELDSLTAAMATGDLWYPGCDGYRILYRDHELVNVNMRKVVGFSKD